MKLYNKNNNIKLIKTIIPRRFTLKRNSSINIHKRGHAEFLDPFLLYSNYRTLNGGAHSAIYSSLRKLEFHNRCSSEDFYQFYINVIGGASNKHSESSPPRRMQARDRDEAVAAWLRGSSKCRQLHLSLQHFSGGYDILYFGKPLSSSKPSPA